jgi:restriction system protein
MTDFTHTPWFLPAVAVVALLLGLLAWRWYAGRKSPLQKAVSDISFDRLEDLIIPSADEGEIHIDELLLTSQGLLVLEVKDVRGKVFGSDKMSDWTVIAEDRRFTFSNPQPGLYDRIAAVRQIVRQVPVEGRVVFLEGADFTKGVPSLVCTLEQLVTEFGEADMEAARSKVEAFKPHWEQVRKAAG